MDEPPDDGHRLNVQLSWRGPNGFGALCHHERDRRNRLVQAEAGNEAFSNLVGEEWGQHALERDLAKRSAVKTFVPVRHVTNCVMNYFKGQSFRGTTEDDILDTFKSLGLKVDFIKKIPTGGTSRRCIVFPLVQGLTFLLKKKRWMSDEVVSYHDED